LNITKIYHTAFYLYLLDVFLNSCCSCFRVTVRKFGLLLHILMSLHFLPHPLTKWWLNGQQRSTKLHGNHKLG